MMMMMVMMMMMMMIVVTNVYDAKSSVHIRSRLLNKSVFLCTGRQSAWGVKFEH